MYSLNASGMFDISGRHISEPSNVRLHNVVQFCKYWLALVCNIGTSSASHPIRDDPVD